MMKFLRVVIMVILTVSGSEGQLCSGTETFEKVVGVNVSSSNKIPLYASQGNTVTAECNNRCRASEDCPVFLLDYSTSICWRLDKEEEMLISGGSKTSYFQKICLNAPACERAWIYERVVGYELEGYDDRVIGSVRSRIACQELCIMESEFQCASAEYNYKEQICRLSSESRRSRPESYRPTTRDVDYLENQCQEVRERNKCQYEHFHDQELGYGDIQVLDVGDHIQCGDICDQTSAFTCRSYTYYPGTGLCRLSGDDTLSGGSLIVRPGAEYYQHLPCLDRDRVKRQLEEVKTKEGGEVSLVCTGESMTVTLETDEPFTGRLFSQSGGRNCDKKGTARTETSITFFYKGQGAERCGVSREDGGVYSAVVVVQHHPVVQRKGDRAVQLYCFFETGDKTVTNGYDVLADRTGARDDDTIDGGISISTPSSVVNATAPSPGVRLRITTESGEDISGTRLGEKLFLRIEMDRESIFGLFARNLKAVSGDNEDSIDLLDDKGCPTDPLIFPGLEKVPDSRHLQGNFEAFKFSDTRVVRFQVNVQFCVDECNPVDCGDGLLSYGRKKREVDRSRVTLPPGAGSTLSIGPYSSRLVYDPNLDQEVIYNDTSLSMEILVDSGTKVDREPRTKSHQGGVFIHADNGDGEVVCTTWPTIIASGAAVVFLQMCILSTCLLCLYTNRHSRGKCDHLDHQSVYSGTTNSVPTTLYHDHHTYRPTMSRVTEDSDNTIKSLRTTLRD